MKKILFATLVVVFHTQTFACTVIPSNEGPNWSEIAKDDSITYLVQSSEIYLATAVSKVTTYRHMADFKFKVDEILRGKDRKEIKLNGADLDFDKDFYKNEYHDRSKGHKDPLFWSFQVDNGADFGDCINRGFYRVGTQYLLFINNNSKRRSFEPIVTNEDLWLKTVREVVSQVKFIETGEIE